jgi:hypothetical protein
MENNDCFNDYYNDFHILYPAEYRYFFEQVEVAFKGKTTVNHYHNLYVLILNDLCRDALTAYISAILSGKELSTSYVEIVTIYQNDKKKLDDLFSEFTRKLGTQTDMSIKQFPKYSTDKEKKVLETLAGLYLIRPELQRSGKYKMVDKKNCRKIIEVVLSNNNLNDNGTYFFIDNFIEYDVDISSVKRYINDIHFEIQKRSRIK